MALRVLLADESPTTKKVMQLALQDFAVEVKNVPAGAEVLDVAKTFKPDIVFADVLLPKRSGYEVCADFRKHKDPGLAQVPVVLMWSGFMALDADRATKAGYSGKLEKPFDADTLRELIMALVPKAKTNPIADFLSFPNLPNFIEESSQPSEPVPMELPDSSDIPQSLQWKGNAPAEKLPQNLPKLPSQTPNSNPTKAANQPPGWEVNEDDEVITVIREMPLEQIHNDDHGAAEEEVSVIHLDTNIEAESFESEDFKESPIVVPKSSSEIEDSDDSEWKRQDLSKFKIDDEENLEDDFAQKFIIPENELNLNELQIQNDGEFAEVSFEPPAKASQSSVSGSKNKIDQAKKPETPIAKDKTRTAPSTAASQSLAPQQQKLSQEQIEAAIINQSREIIESVAWKILPEIIERVVREELDKLLREVDNNL